MKDLTQQMLADYKPFIKKSHWQDFEKARLEEVEELGPVLNIVKNYSVDGKRLLEKIYQREHDLGTPYGFTLDSVHAGVDSLPE